MFEVDARGGFVQHEEIRLTRESPGNQDALLLPTRECRNVGIELLRQSNQSSGVADGVSIGSGQWPKVFLCANRPAATISLTFDPPSSAGERCGT